MTVAFNPFLQRFGEHDTADVLCDGTCFGFLYRDARGINFQWEREPTADQAFAIRRAVADRHPRDSVGYGASPALTVPCNPSAKLRKMPRVSR